MRRWAPIVLAVVCVGGGYRDTPNYTQIERGLFLGGYVKAPPPGAKAVLNLCETDDPYEVPFHRWDLIRDAPPAPSLKWLWKQVQFVDAQRQAGRTVYVHCHAGISRSAMVVAAYYMYRHGWTRDQALRFIRERRPIVQPNGAFMDLLKEYERWLDH